MRRYIFLLVSTVVLLLLTIPTIVSGRFTFAFDMGRDMLWTRNMVELKLPTLIGPWGSIAGVYFGPLWYYLLSIPYIITKGDPRGSVLVPLVSNLATLALGWFFLQRKKRMIAANIWALLFAISPLVVSTSSFAFHANLLPLVTLLFFMGLAKPTSAIGPMRLISFPLSALMAGIAYHLEPAAAVMLTLYLGAWFFLKRIGSFGGLQADAASTGRRIRSLLVIAAFGIPFLPQLLFELRHQFVQTRALISYFRGENTSLGGVLPLNQRLTERIDKISGSLSYSLFPVPEIWQQWLILAIFLLLIIIAIKKYRPDHFSHYFLLLTPYFLLFHYLAYTFLFPAELKGWYLYGLAALYIMSTALLFEYFIDFWSKEKLIRLIPLFLLILLFLQNINPIDRYFSKSETPAMETLTAQLAVVDWVYADALADGRPFSIYTYTPPIYEYNYQYLIWWRGMRRFGILPAEYSYVPGESSYVPRKEHFQSQKWSPNDAEIAYLILEPDRIQDRVDGWLGNFTSLNQVLVQKFDSGLTVEKRSFP